jgi:acyl carrier protein
MIEIKHNMDDIAVKNKDISRIVAEVMEIDTDSINVQESLSRLGVDSVRAVRIKAQVELAYHVPIPYELLVSGPAIQAISEYIVQAGDGSSDEDNENEVFNF